MTIPISWWIGGGLAIALGVQTFHVSILNSRWDRHLLADKQAEVNAEKEKNNIETIWRKKLEAQEVEYEAKFQSQQRDIVDASASRDRMLQHIANLVAKARDPRPVAPGKTVDSGDPIGVLADVLAGADRLAEVYARTADERGLRGERCEAEYGAVASP